MIFQSVGVGDFVQLHESRLLRSIKKMATEQSALNTKKLEQVSEQIESFKAKEWSKQVLKKTTVGMCVGAVLGVAMGIARKRFAGADSALNRWAIGSTVKPRKPAASLSSYTSEFSQVEAPLVVTPSIFKTTIALTGNIGLCCYFYFSVEEYLTMKQLTPTQFISHFITGFGMYSLATFTKKLLTYGVSPIISIPFHLVKSMGGGLVAGSAAMACSLLYSYGNYRFQLYKLRNNLTLDEYRKLVSGDTEEIEEKTMSQKFQDSMPVWLKTPSAQTRTMLDEMRKYEAIRSVEITTLNKQKNDSASNFVFMNTTNSNPYKEDKEK